jgi:hypothetical protein
MSESSEKRRPIWKYWGRVIKHSGSDISLVEAISEMAIGIMIALSTPGENVHDMIREAIGFAIGVPALAFMLRCLFITPAKLYREIEDELEILESKIQEIQNEKPLEIEALPAKKIVENVQYACEVIIHNPNQPISGIALRLLSIEPPIQGVGTITTDDCELHRVKFSFNDLNGDVLKRNQRGHICLFKATRIQKTNTTDVDFDGQWPTNLDTGYVPKENQQYILTFEISCDGPPTMQIQFKLSFSSAQNPPFVLEKINPPQPVNSLEKSAAESLDKAKKHSDPASVVILICLSASLVALTAAQRFQIFKLKNPPTPQSIARKPLPDKIISQPAKSNIPPIISPPQVTNVELPIQFVTNYPSADSGDSESELAKIKAKKLAEIAAKKEADRKQTQSDSDGRWKVMLPAYKDCIETFYNILKKEADRRNEPIAKTDNYFSCLPSTINYELGETNIAEIRFSESTNVNFHIAITSGDQFQQRGLKISGSCGYFEIRHHPIYVYNQCIIGVHIQDLNDDRDASLDQTHDLIEEDLKLLKDGQIAYLSQTNHTTLK